MKGKSQIGRQRYSADVEADFTGRPQKFGSYDEAAEAKEGAEKGDGTEASGYVQASLGPFRCDNCMHFQDPNGCDHPAVTSDPEVKGKVEPGGCCNYFKSKRNSEAPPTSNESAEYEGVDLGRE
jgi:hypothetical protein